MAARITGNACRCPTCNRAFRAVTSYEAHRVGPWHERRCRDDIELRTGGWQRDRDGYWHEPTPASRGDA